MAFTNKDNLSVQQLIVLAREKRDVYYSNKLRCNRTDDIHEVLHLWDIAEKHWDEAQEIEQYIASLPN